MLSPSQENGHAQHFHVEIQAGLVVMVPHSGRRSGVARKSYPQPPQRPIGSRLPRLKKATEPGNGVHGEDQQHERDASHKIEKAPLHGINSSGELTQSGWLWNFEH
jgi:hypothetical protein